MRLGRRPLNAKTAPPGNSNVSFDASFALRRKIGAIRTAFESRFQCHQLTYGRAVAVRLIQSATCIGVRQCCCPALRLVCTLTHVRRPPPASYWMTCLARSKESPACLYARGVPQGVERPRQSADGDEASRGLGRVAERSGACAQAVEGVSVIRTAGLSGERRPVGKGTHHAVVLDRKGKRLLDGALPYDESKLRTLIGRLKERERILGRLLIEKRLRQDALLD